MILIVEPHPDDCCISAFRFCKEFKEDITLYSIFTNSKRSSKVFCRYMGINYFEFPPVEESQMNEYKMKRSILYSSVNSYDAQQEYYGAILKEKYTEVLDSLEQVCKELHPKEIVTCLGIYHPFHVIVNMAVKSLYPESKMFVDLPYASRKYGKKIYEDSRYLPEISYDYEEEISKEKIKVFLNSYPTEKGMMRWDRDAIAKHPEIILGGIRN
jgi:LmbE family N-acetylglucosaminyl deacetylase